MTTTNRAFIKAYRQDAAQPSPATEPPAILADPRQAAFALMSASKKVPLSTFVGGGKGPSRAEAIGRSESPAPTEFFRPGTTVASFEWPAVCRALVQQCGQQLDDVSKRLRAQADQGRSLVGVVGLFTGCGATTTTLCLGARLAGAAHRLILMDGNFRQPGMAASLKATPTAGWEEVLKHAALLSDAVVYAADDRLALLPLSARPRKDAITLATGLQAAVTAGVLRHAYDLILVDLGAFFDASSQPVLLELVRNLGVDAAIAVTMPGGADPRDLAAMSEKLGVSGCELLGTIENRIAKPKAA